MPGFAQASTHRRCDRIRVLAGIYRFADRVLHPQAGIPASRGNRMVEFIRGILVFRINACSLICMIPENLPSQSLQTRVGPGNGVKSRFFNH